MIAGPSACRVSDSGSRMGADLAGSDVSQWRRGTAVSSAACRQGCPLQNSAGSVLTSHFGGTGRVAFWPQFPTIMVF